MDVALASEDMRQKCLNPFDIRATAWTDAFEKAEQWSNGLNPFDIRATAWTHA